MIAAVIGDSCMNRLLCSTLLFALLFALPANTAEPHVCNDTYTLRTPDMTYYDSIRAGDELVLAAAPEWYVEGTPEMPIIVQANPDLLRLYGEAWLDDQGVYHVAIGRLGLMLSTIEDLASVLLHEYVHVIAWEEIEAHDWSDNCKSVRQELLANKVVIEYYHKLGYTQYMLNNSRNLYAEAKAKGLLNQCPADVTSGMPEVPMPQVLKFQLN